LESEEGRPELPTRDPPGNEPPQRAGRYDEEEGGTQDRDRLRHGSSSASCRDEAILLRAAVKRAPRARYLSARGRGDRLVLRVRQQPRPRHVPGPAADAAARYARGDPRRVRAALRSARRAG